MECIDIAWAAKKFMTESQAHLEKLTHFRCDCIIHDELCPRNLDEIDVLRKRRCTAILVKKRLPNRPLQSYDTDSS